MSDSVACLGHNALAMMVNLFVEGGPVQILADGPGGTVEEHRAESEIADALRCARVALPTLRAIAQGANGQSVEAPSATG